MHRIAILLAALFSATTLAAEIEVNVVFLRAEREQPPTLSNLDPVPVDLGLAGAMTGTQDNATTGRFMGQTHALVEIDVPLGDDIVEAARAALAGDKLMVLDVPADALLEIADLPEAADALLFNAGSSEPALRDSDCRANVLHTLPSTAMRSDALVQFLVKKRWDDVVMISGTHAEDRAFAGALERSLTKFGLDLRAAKDWVFDADMRRNAAVEVPLFTQEFGEYDVLLVTDEIGDFSRYIPYNTWEPRPVAGSEGLVPVAWGRVVEQWGAAQLQSRFVEAHGRPMRSRDYAAWAAFRAIGEAVTRTGAADPASIRDYLLSDRFELAGFKGRPMTFRNWNGQLRQPIPLVHANALVAQAPLEGFLHQRNDLDTLGLDAPETDCTAF